MKNFNLESTKYSKDYFIMMEGHSHPQHKIFDLCSFSAYGLCNGKIGQYYPCGKGLTF